MVYTETHTICTPKSLRRQIDNFNTLKLDKLLAVDEMTLIVFCSFFNRFGSQYNFFKTVNQFGTPCTYPFVSKGLCTLQAELSRTERCKTEPGQAE